MALPVELLFRVCGFLSPEDLTVAAQTCRLLRDVASCEEIWRRLFQARYLAEQPGKHSTLAVHRSGASSYKQGAGYVQPELLLHS